MRTAPLAHFPTFPAATDSYTLGGYCENTPLPTLFGAELGGTITQPGLLSPDPGGSAQGSAQTLFLSWKRIDVFTYLSRAQHEWCLGTVESPTIATILPTILGLLEHSGCHSPPSDSPNPPLAPWRLGRGSLRICPDSWGDPLSRAAAWGSCGFWPLGVSLSSL